MAFVYRFGVAAWLGTVVGVSLLVAPIVFRSLPRQTAGEVMGKVFGAYYLLGMGLGAAALAAVVMLSLRTRWHWDRLLAVGMLVAMIGTAGYARFALAPQIVELRTSLYAAREAGGETAPIQEALDQVHHRSVLLNGVVLLGGGIILTLVGALRERRDTSKQPDEAGGPGDPEGPEGPERPGNPAIPPPPPTSPPPSMPGPGPGGGFNAP